MHVCMYITIIKEKETTKLKGVRGPHDELKWGEGG